MSHSSAPVLNAVMNSFKPEYIAQKAMMFADMVRDCEETGLPKVRVQPPHELFMYLLSLDSSTSCMSPWATVWWLLTLLRRNDCSCSIL